MHIDKEHWLGLDNIYKLTNRKNVKVQLKIILEQHSGIKNTVTYDDFRLKDQVVYTSVYSYIHDDEYHNFHPSLSHISLHYFDFRPHIGYTLENLMELFQTILDIPTICPSQLLIMIKIYTLEIVLLHMAKVMNTGHFE